MGLNVLVVDDSAVMRSVIVRILHMTGVPLGSVHAAGTATYGFELLQRMPVDLLLLDINMPSVRGDEMLEALRLDPRFASLPVVVVSSERSAERLARVEALGAVVVHKPFTPEQLGAVLTTITGSRHAVHAR